MNKLVGGLLAVAAIAAGIYVDIVWLLVGGIREIIRGATASPLDGSQLGWGIAHVVFSGLGTAAAIFLVILGIAIATEWNA